MKGFTLIETLVAITVLTTAIVGPFYAIQTAVRISYLARDQVIASALAQEGIEYVRSVRDNNYLNGNTWLANLAVCNPGPCTVDTVFAPHLSAVIQPLYLSTTNIYNQQTAGEITRFTRTVEIAEINAHEASVTVTVTWDRHGPQQVIVSDILQDWL